jgi:hypothetical protein
MSDRSARRRVGIELGMALSLLLWRLFATPPQRLWRDWMVVLSLYWIGSLFRSEKPSWPIVTATAMAYLLGIAVLGQLPHALAVLGVGPS